MSQSVPSEVKIPLRLFNEMKGMCDAIVTAVECSESDWAKFHPEDFSELAQEYREFHETKYRSFLNRANYRRKEGY